MDYDMLERWFDAADNEHAEFDRIPAADRLHPSRRLCGLLKIASLMTDPADFDISAEHDEIFLADPDELRSDVTEADVVYMRRCGVRLGEYGLAMFT